jgi:hypothetical protein
MLALLAVLAVDSLSPKPDLTLEVSPRLVILRVGPLELPASPGANHATLYNQGNHDLPLLPFVWPMDAWARGFRLTIRDGSGRVLPNRLLHHLNVIHQGRRQLLQPMFERTIAMGQEAREVRLPATIGVRIEAGSPMALHLALVNDTPEALSGVTVELSIDLHPYNLVPRPREVRPVAFDIGITPGGNNSFTLPGGTSVFQREFVIPVSGRLLGLGAHLHQLADSISLIEVRSGRVLATLRPQTDSAGRILRVTHRLFGVTGPGLKLRAGERYRVLAVYTNPGVPQRDGGMAAMAGIFMPDNLRGWPVLDRSDPGLLADLALLNGRLAAGAGHHH